MLDRVMVAGPDVTPLAERILDHYRHTPLTVRADELQVKVRAFAEELLRSMDAADLVASLVISLPSITIENDVHRWHVENGYHWTIAHGLDRLEKTPVGDW